MKRLWEVDHEYYCSDANYYSDDCHKEYSSWADFLDEEGDSAMYYNLVFRWDWKGPTNDDGEPVVQPDDNYRDSTLQLFYMGQRKGLFRCVEVQVCRADEPAIRNWLQPRMDYLMALWAPLQTSVPAEP